MVSLETSCDAFDKSFLYFRDTSDVQYYEPNKFIIEYFKYTRSVLTILLNLAATR